MKINVIGTSGSVKSTFAKKLSAALGHPYVEMDKIFWEPNWKMPSDEVFFSRLQAALQGEDWVLDGNYTRTVPIKWQQIDLVIWLDYSFARTLFQAVCRAARRAWSKDELWEGTGNRETFRKSFFSKESIIWWTITSYKKVRERYERTLMEPKFTRIRFVRLKNHAEAEMLLEELKKCHRSL